MPIEFISSQIFIVLAYAALTTTYFVKAKKNVLVFNFIYLATLAVAYFLLDAYTGMAMMAVAVLRNTAFLIRNKEVGEKQKAQDYAILTVLFVLIFTAGAFTYQGFWSIFSLLATSIYTFSIWQTNKKVYSYLGIVTAALWLAYNIFVRSVVGAVLDVVLLGFIIAKIIMRDMLKKK